MQNLQTFYFQEKEEIQIILINGEPWFVAQDVALVLGYLRKNGKVDTNAMTRKIEPEDKGTTKIRTLGGEQEKSIINESGLYIAIFGSAKEEAKKFKFWVTREILPEIRKTGSYSLENSQQSAQPQPDQNIINNIFALEKSFVNLRLSEASKILMTEKLYKKLKLETNYLPKYTEEKLTRSLTYLLKKYEIKLSTQKANLKLLEAGILEKLERDSSCGNKKYFYSITENGLKFGKNLISPKNERETQPHFYESKFLELVKLF